MMNKLLLLLLLLVPALGQAACDLPAAAASFGSVTSFTIGSTVSTTTTNAQINCGAGSILTLLGNNYITLQLAGASTAASTRGTMKRSGDTSLDNIPVRLCIDSACSREMLINGTVYNFPQSQLLNLVGLLGNLNFSIPLYLRTVPGQTVAAGTYTVTLNVAVTWRICRTIAIINCTNEDVGSGVLPLTATIVITNDCTTITAPSVSFGSAPLAGSFSSVSQTINVVCTKGSTYTVGLSNGSYAANNVRNMASGNNRLSYDIYKGTSTSRWGPAGTERQSSTGASAISADGVTRTFAYTARILTTQATPPPGTYSDTVVVDLSF